MKDSNLFELIQSLSSIEKKEVARFLESSFFNTRNDVQELFSILRHSESPEQLVVWEKLFPRTPFDSTQLRLLMSYLNRLLESYLLVREEKEGHWEQKIKLAAIYRNRGLNGHSDRQTKAFAKALEAQPRRNAEYYASLRKLHQQQYNTEIIHNPTDTLALKALAKSTDLQYLTQRLQLICLTLSQQNIYKAAQEENIQQEIVALAEKKEWRHLPAISTYLAAVRLLTNPEHGQHYLDFRQKIRENEIYFSGSEMREFYMFAINHCVRKANSGAKEFEQELFTTYKMALQAGYLFEGGLLSRFTFHNIAGAALRANEQQWMELFIEEYHLKLEEKYQDSSYQFNKARLAYARGHFDQVLDLLQQANYADPLLSLAAKTLLLKTYFETDEYDSLSSHLDAMRNYIHRKKVIGYHRSNYLNIIRYTELLISTGTHNKHQLQQLKQKIDAEPVLTEKEWLLKQFQTL